MSTLIVGTYRIDAPFLGGRMVPAPEIIVTGLPINGFGEAKVRAIFLQMLVLDPTAPQGMALSNAVLGVTQ